MSTAAITESSARTWEQVDLYRFFAFALGSPSREIYEWFARAEAEPLLHELWQQLECEGAPSEFRWFECFEDYEAAYIALFDAGVPEPPVPLFESAHDKTRPPQELVLENTYFYDLLGLRTDASRSVPDYLLTQLEFLSAIRYAREHAATAEDAAGPARAEREFLERHLMNWLPTARRKLDRLDARAFPTLLALLEGFLKSRLRRTLDLP